MTQNKIDQLIERIDEARKQFSCDNRSEYNIHCLLQDCKAQFQVDRALLYDLKTELIILSCEMDDSSALDDAIHKIREVLNSTEPGNQTRIEIDDTVMGGTTTQYDKDGNILSKSKLDEPFYSFLNHPSYRDMWSLYFINEKGEKRLSNIAFPNLTEALDFAKRSPLSYNYAYKLSDITVVEYIPNSSEFQKSTNN